MLKLFPPLVFADVKEFHLVDMDEWKKHSLRAFSLKETMCLEQCSKSFLAMRSMRAQTIPTGLNERLKNTRKNTPHFSLDSAFSV